MRGAYMPIYNPNIVTGVFSLKHSKFIFFTWNICIASAFWLVFTQLHWDKKKYWPDKERRPGEVGCGNLCHLPPAPIATQTSKAAMFHSSTSTMWTPVETGPTSTSSVRKRERDESQLCLEAGRGRRGLGGKGNQRQKTVKTNFLVRNSTSSVNFRLGLCF